MHRSVNLPLASLAICLSVGSLGAVPLRAQTLPGASSTDLTMPPDLREGAARPTGQDTRSSKRRHTTPMQRVARPLTTPSDPAPIHKAMPDQHPVDLGVTMRGGSGTARAYAPTGDSEVLQEGGSAFGAGMKLGF